MNSHIIPAILPKDFNDLVDHVEKVRLGTEWIQIDICDGKLTPEASWPYRKPDNTFEMIVREDQALPAWETVEYEIDLMVDKPEVAVEDWVSAGASRIIVHAGAHGDVREAILSLRGRVEVGLAITLDTTVEDIRAVGVEIGGPESDIQFIQVMGIRRIGFQGQQFDAEVLDVIREIRDAYPDITITVDGGVSLDNFVSLFEAGAERLVVGSAIFNTENPLEALEAFK